MSENLNPNLIPSSPRTPLPLGLNLKCQKLLRRLSRNSNNRCPMKPVMVPAPVEMIPDQVLMLILSKLNENQRKLVSLVCKRWLDLSGGMVRSIKVLDWGFLKSGRLEARFPNLRSVDLVNACVRNGRDLEWNVVLSHRLVKVDVSVYWIGDEDWFLAKEEVDEGMRRLKKGFGELRKLVAVAGSEMGLLSVAEGCGVLQELELYRCSDQTLRAIAAFENLQVLKLIGNVGGLGWNGYVTVTDIGLTILAQGCKRLMKLELSGCEGSYDGIKAIGQCCQMLEELTLSEHMLDDGWLAGLSYCQNLRSLSFQSCRRIDDSPGPEEYLSCCPSLESLHLLKCQLRNIDGLKALFMVCHAVKDIVIQDCWGFNDEMFNIARTCRKVTQLSLEGCSIITTSALESVVLSLVALERLRVLSCKNVKNSEVSSALSTLFTTLQELKWMPDAKSLLSSNLSTAMGRRGGKFFKK